VENSLGAVPAEQIAHESFTVFAGKVLKDVLIEDVHISDDLVNCMGLGEPQQKADGFQALGPLFQNIPHQDQNVIGAKGHLFQQGFENIQTPVDVADGDNPPPLGKGYALDNGVHGYTLAPSQN